MNKPSRGIDAYKKEAEKKAAANPGGRPAHVEAGGSSVPAPAKGRPGPAQTGKKGSGTEAPGARGANAKISAPSGQPRKDGEGSAASRRQSTSSGNSQNSDTVSSLEGLLKVQKGGGLRKAAKLLLLLGKDHAVQVVRHLSNDEIEDLSREIARIKRVEKVEAVKLLEEFGILAKQVRAPHGGLETAKELLVTAFGEEKGTEFLKRAVPIEGERPFAFMDDLEDQQIILLLKNEPPPVLAVVLRFLEPKKSSAVIASFPQPIQKEVLLRIARMDKIDSLVFSRMEEVLKDKLHTQGTIITEEIDGATALADILKHMDLADEERILNEISTADSILSDEVKERLFTIDVLFTIADTDLQNILRDYSDQEIAVLIKGKPEEVKERFLSCVSQRRRDFIVEESAHLGSMKRSEVDKLTREFLDYLWKLESEKKLVIHRENEYFI